MSYNTSPASADLTSYAGQVDSVIIAAMNQAELYVDGVYGAKYPGVMSDIAQASLWPRKTTSGLNIILSNGRELSITVIPEQILQAEIEATKLMLDGSILLPKTVASATTASTQNSQIIEESVQAGSVKSTTRWSPSSTTTSQGAQILTSTGLPIIALIETIMASIIATNNSGSNRYIMRA